MEVTPDLLSKCATAHKVTSVTPGIVVCGDMKFPSAAVQRKKRGAGLEKQREKEQKRKAELAAFVPPPHTTPTSGQQLKAIMDIVMKSSTRDPILSATLFQTPITMALICWWMKGYLQP